MATYDNGLYTPYTTAATTPAYTSAAANTWWTAPTTAATSAAVSSPTSSAESAPPTSSAPSSSASLATKTPPSSTAAVALSSTSNASSSSHSAAARESLASSQSAVASLGAPPFKLTYLIPVFVILPIVIIFTLLGWTYGRCWGRQSRTGGTGDDGGARQDEWSHGILSPEEKGALVEGKFVGGDYDDEKRSVASTVDARRSPSAWEQLKRMVSKSSTSTHIAWDDGREQFLAVPYSTLEQPFRPPTASSAIPRGGPANGADDEPDDDERGWKWGTQKRPEAGPSTGISRSASMNVWSLASRKYRAKSASSRGSHSGKTLGRSDTVISRLSARLFGGDAPGSPSIYSATEESGPYTGLDEGDHDALLDAMLAESRVGSGDLAKRYISGETVPGDFNIPRSTSDRPVRAAASKPIAVDMPTAPRPSHKSPTKGRGVLPQTPPQKSGAILFAYDSPPSASSYTALPQPRSATRRPFPRDAAIPPVLRALSPPPRADSVIPIDTLLFSTSPIPNPRNIGAPMPAYSEIRASESAFSLSGVQGLVYGEDSLTGLRERARENEAPSREEQTTLLRNSAPTLPASVPAVAPIPRLPSSGPRGIQIAARTSMTGPRNISGPNSTVRPPQKVPHRSSMAVAPSASQKFDPAFSEPAKIRPLSHPSRVRAAVEELETRSPPLGSPALVPLQTRVEPERLPMPPSPQKLSRSTTRIERDDDTDRIAGLLLQRSKTHLSAAPPSSNGHGGSSNGHESEVEESPRKRMMGPREVRRESQPAPASEPRRASSTWRRTTGPAVRAAIDESPDPGAAGRLPRVATAPASAGGARGVALDAMLRRSVPAER